MTKMNETCLARINAKNVIKKAYILIVENTFVGVMQNVIDGENSQEQKKEKIFKQTQNPSSQLTQTRLKLCF